LILPLLLAADPAADTATTVSSFRLKGNTATALFLAPDPLDSCLESIVSVASSDLLEKVLSSGKTVSLRTALVVIEFDVCTNTLLFSGEGETATHSFQVAADLSTATLTVQVQLSDAVSTLVYPFQVSLTWKATGKAQTSNTVEKFHDKEAGLKITTKSHSTIVDAAATGTVFGRGRNHTPAPSDSATIQKQNDGTHVIEKTP
jgi:hypothetical protein